MACEGGDTFDVRLRYRRRMMVDATAPTPSSTAPTPTPSSATLETTCGDGSKIKLARACTSDADCGFFDERGCCGHGPAIGVRAADAKRADPQCPKSDCSHMGCPSGGLLAEDGHSTFNREEIAVRCAQGTCTTRVATAGCCEDGLTWAGCCSTPSNPKSHQCGDPAPCAIVCVGQKSCKQ